MDIKTNKHCYPLPPESVGKLKPCLTVGIVKFGNIWETQHVLQMSEFVLATATGHSITDSYILSNT